MAGFGRIPVMPLPYSEKQRALKKELLVDYESGNIYVVSATDQSVIIDITSKIKDHLTNFGSDISLDIDGIGAVKLTEILTQMKADIGLTVLAEDLGEDKMYLDQDDRLDNKSISIVDHFIEVHGFVEAADLSIPQKYQGAIRWMPAPQIGDNGGEAQAVDGYGTSVQELLPSSGKIYLSVTNRQRTIDLSAGVQVILPQILDSYGEIKWNLKTNAYLPTLTFSGNVIFEKINNFQPVANAYHVYQFETWDAGVTWLARVTRFGQTT